MQVGGVGARTLGMWLVVLLGSLPVLHDILPVRYNQSL